MTDFNWTATFGEVKTAAQWTDLGDNDRFLYTYTGEGTNAIQQIQHTTYASVATGTTILPADNTIPQITEGDEYMTQAITPKSATNLLVIRGSGMWSFSGGAQNIIVALFQDSTANALYATETYSGTSTAITTVPFFYKMTAGTTSSTTFRIRMGGGSAGTNTFNGSGGTARFSTTPKSYIEVIEYKV